MNNDPLYIGNEMAAFDRKDREYYDKFTDEQRKQFSTYLMLRYGASVDLSKLNLTAEEKFIITAHYLVQTNNNVNKNFFDLNKHPKLQWLLCTTVSPNMGTMNHYWQGTKKKEGSNSKLQKYIAELYPAMKQDEIELLAKLNDKRDFEDLARKHGLDDKSIKSKF